MVAKVLAFARAHSSRLGIAGLFFAGAVTVAAAPGAYAYSRTSGSTPAPSRGPLALLSTSDAPSPAPSPGTVAVLAPLPSAQPQPLVPAQPAKSPSASIRWAYMVGNSIPASLRDHPDQIDVISPAWFHSDANGNLYGNDSPAVTQFARAHGIKVMPIVANGEFQGSVSHALLTDGNRQTTLLDSLQWLTQTYGYEGVNIDFENIAVGDRDGFSALMSNVYARLHPLGKVVTAAIPAKTAEKYTGFAGPFDYAALAPNMDLAVIMAYDQHWSGGSPGPIADIAWVNDVLNYAQSQIPASKLLLGIPFYGYDWGGGYGKSTTYSDVVNKVFANGAQIVMDAASQSPTFSYAGHQVWFENSDSLRAKLTLVQTHHLAGWGAWRLGQEDPNFWALSLR